MTTTTNTDDRCFYIDPAVLNVTDNASMGAVGTFLYMCCWASRHRTDNLIPKVTPLADIDPRATRQQVDELAEVGIITDSGDAWRLNYYSKKNPDDLD